MANYWMHNGFLQVEGAKMSKSDGNFVTIRELLDTEPWWTIVGGSDIASCDAENSLSSPIDWTVIWRLEEIPSGAILNWATIYWSVLEAIGVHVGRELWRTSIIGDLTDDLIHSAMAIR